MEHKNKFYNYNPYAIDSYQQIEDAGFQHLLGLSDQDYKSLVSSHFAYWSNTNVFLIDKSFLVKEGSFTSF